MSKAFLVCCAALALSLAAPLETRAATLDVRTFGAKADGKALDRDAINKAIDAAVAAGGGTVCFPAGTYITGSIRLRSNITLQLEPRSVLEASPDAAAYDAAEPNQWDKFHDFGHSHWHNSLIWGDGLENVSIVGGGLITGKALARERGGALKLAATSRTDGTVICCQGHCAGKGAARNGKRSTLIAVFISKHIGGLRDRLQSKSRGAAIRRHRR